MSFMLHVERRPRTPHSDAVTAGTPLTVATTLPMVCLHGWGMNLRVFDLLRDALAAERETLAVDLAGHGASAWAAGHAQFDTQMEDVLAVLPPRCVLLGWSFGGKLALALAARHPARIAALVLVSATPKFAQSADWPHGLDADSMQAFRAVLEQDWQQTLSDFVWLQLRGSRNAEAAQRVLEAALAQQGKPHPEALRNGLDLLHTLDLRAHAVEVMQPTLVISGQNDRVTPPGAARWLAAALPQAQLVEVPRAGHAPFVSHHQEVAAAVRVFLAATAATAATRA
ncbi:MAG: alpha/beta fold hydrolase [Steroidobacteraceae bacterium]